MIKTLLASFAAGSAAVLAGPALAADVYFNPEINSGFVDSDYVGSVVEAHVGVEGDHWYLQGGPAILAPQHGDSEVELSGKVGGSLPISADGKISVYGEAAAMTGDDLGINLKAGAKIKL